MLSIQGIVRSWKYELQVFKRTAAVSLPDGQPYDEIVFP